jgi:hypothetical protein
VAVVLSGVYPGASYDENRPEVGSGSPSASEMRSGLPEQAAAAIGRSHGAFRAMLYGAGEGLPETKLAE